MVDTALLRFELRIKAGRKVVFSRVGTLEECTSWIDTWESYESLVTYTYVLYPVGRH